MEFDKTGESTILQTSSSCMWINTTQRIFIASQVFRIYHQNGRVEDINWIIQIPSVQKKLRPRILLVMPQYLAKSASVVSIVSK